MGTIRTTFAVASLALLACIFLHWAGPAEAQVAPADAKPYLKASPDDMQWWRDARFGLFIHWGPVSLKGTEIGWSRGGQRPGMGGTGEIPAEVYDNLYKEFNPTKFNAKEWVAIAKAAGMKYLVFTSKHHDGFVNFDSQLTDYKITSPQSPFRRDIVKELADACHEAGLRFGLYYSPPDFHHPDYRTANHARYIEYLHGQIRELCTNYGKLDILWFDGLNSKIQELDSENLFKMVRELQPHILINNRACLPGDFGTPEQAVGGFDRDRAWESCITICQQWAWKPNDTMKSFDECVQTLARCVGGDGNLLLNVGPMPTGEIEPRQVERLNEVGAWLAKNGESIYGTRGGPFRPGSWGASTCKGNTIYVHAFTWDGPALTLPAIGKKVVSARLLGGDKIAVTQTPDAITIPVAAAQRVPADTVIALELDGPALDIPPIAVGGSLTTGKKARASNVYQNLPEFVAAKAVDDDPGTRWATDGGTHEVWFEVDLGAPMAFNRVAIDEAIEKRVQSFELQVKQGDAWKTILRGDTIGPKWSKEFDTVTAQEVRLNILKAAEGPTLNEFNLYAPKK